MDFLSVCRRLPEVRRFLIVFCWLEEVRSFLLVRRMFREAIRSVPLAIGDQI